mgnify:CR=1 FL=1
MKPDSTNGPSLSMRLSLSLVSIVFVVVATILAVGFTVYSRNLEADLEGQSEEYASKLAEILALPLWNYDDTQVRRIGAVFSENQMIHGILVEDDKGRAVFEVRKAEDHAPRILRSNEIRIEGKIIGKVSIEITHAIHMLHLRLLLIGTLLTLLAALLVMLLGTNHLLARFLRRPLESLEQAMDRVASGDFSHAIDHPHRELQGIARRYAEMVERVHSREEKLQQMNRELLSEIAERKTVEEHLALSNALLETQLRNSPDGILMVSPEGRIIHANPAFVDMWRLPEYPLAMGPVEVLFDAMGERLKWTGGAPTFPALAEETSSGKPRRELYLDDGRVFEFHCGSMLGHGGRGFGRAFTFHDATEQKRTEEMPRESEVRYRTLFKNSPISLRDEDWSEVKRLLDGLRPSVPDFREYLESHPEVVLECMKLVRVVDVNDETLTMLRAETLESLLRGLHAVMTDELLAAFRHGLITLLQGWKRCTVETTYRTLAGGQVDVSVSIQVAPGYEETWGKVFVSVLDITERKRTEETLKEKERLLAQTNTLLELVLDAIPVRIFWKDLQGRYLGCNAAFVHDASCSHPSDIIGKDDFDMGWRNQAELYRADDAYVIRTGVPKINYEEPQTTPDGGEIWLRTSKIPLRDPEDLIFGVLGVYEDITERKQAHEALKRANLVLEKSPVMLFRWRAAPGWPVELVSENVRQLGYEPGELLSGQIPFADLIHPEDLERVAEEVRDFTERGFERYEQVYRVVTKDGRVRWVDDRTFVERDAEGRVVCYQGIVMDITDRMKAEEGLRESEAKFRALFENLPSGMVLYEVVFEDGGGDMVDYRILDVNPAFERHTGLSAERVLGALASEVFGTGAAPCLEVYGDVARSGRPQVFETWFEPLQRHFQIAAFSPQPGLFATIIEDITERRRNEEELRQRNEEMERFVYTISHDLKSPLVTIQAFLKYLEQDLQSRDHVRVRRDMDYIGNAAARMNRLLDELLELSRIGRKVNPPEHVLLQDVVREALGLVAGRIIERGIHVEVTPEPILLYGDRTRLVEIFQNLIDNAAKFTGDQASPGIRIGAEEDEGSLVLYVRDNGMGIEPRFHEKVFGLFEKLDAGSEGMGVGLALVKRIIEIHSGRIWVESQGPGLGTVFRFTLPGARKVAAH